MKSSNEMKKCCISAQFSTRMHLPEPPLSLKNGISGTSSPFSPLLARPPTQTTVQ